MKAAVVREVGKIGVEEIDRPEAGPGQVLIKVMAAGVCHTDASCLEGNLPVPLPAVLGHEGAGVVEAVGEGVTSVSPGDHVVMSITYGCGRCFQCQQSAWGLCEVAEKHLLAGTMPNGSQPLHANGEHISTFIFQSSFAEWSVIPEACAVRINPDVPFEVAALMSCGASTGYGAVVRRAQVEPGSSVLCLGAGGVGLSVLLAAQFAGATTIIAADMSPEAIAFASELGATHTILVDQDSDVAEQVKAIVPRGVDYSFDSVGADGTLEAAFNSSRNGGLTVAIGATRLDLTATVGTYALIYQKRLTGTVNGSIRPHIDIPAALDAYMAGRLPLDRLITRRYDLDQIDTAIDDLGGSGVGRGMIVM